MLNILSGLRGGCPRRGAAQAAVIVAAGLLFLLAGSVSAQSPTSTPPAAECPLGVFPGELSQLEARYIVECGHCLEQSQQQATATRYFSTQLPTFTRTPVPTSTSAVATPTMTATPDVPSEFYNYYDGEEFIAYAFDAYNVGTDTALRIAPRYKSGFFFPAFTGFKLIAFAWQIDVSPLTEPHQEDVSFWSLCMFDCDPVAGSAWSGSADGQSLASTGCADAEIFTSSYDNICDTFIEGVGSGAAYHDYGAYTMGGGGAGYLGYWVDPSSEPEQPTLAPALYEELDVNLTAFYERVTDVYGGESNTPTPGGSPTLTLTPSPTGTVGAVPDQCYDITITTPNRMDAFEDAAYNNANFGSPAAMNYGSEVNARAAPDNATYDAFFDGTFGDTTVNRLGIMVHNDFDPDDPTAGFVNKFEWAWTSPGGFTSSYWWQLLGWNGSSWSQLVRNNGIAPTNIISFSDASRYEWFVIQTHTFTSGGGAGSGFRYALEDVRFDLDNGSGYETIFLESPLVQFDCAIESTWTPSPTTSASPSMTFTPSLTPILTFTRTPTVTGTLDPNAGYCSQWRYLHTPTPTIAISSTPTPTFHYEGSATSLYSTVTYVPSAQASASVTAFVGFGTGTATAILATQAALTSTVTTATAAAAATQTEVNSNPSTLAAPATAFVQATHYSQTLTALETVQSPIGTPGNDYQVGGVADTRGAGEGIEGGEDFGLGINSQLRAGSCFTFIPHVDLKKVEVEQVRACVVWITFPRLDILGIVIPIELVLIPFMMTVIRWIYWL